MASEAPKRRLTTIVAADVAGYSRLTAADEEATLAALRAHRVELIDPKIAEYRGRIANTAGDSLLMEFASVVDAVRFAVALQQGIDERNADIAQDRRIRFRVGIHLGDVVADAGDLLGDGVNVAARIEALCAPGSLALSDDAYRQVRDRLDLLWIDGGEHELKNLARPIKIWHWATDDDAEMRPEPAGGALPLPEKPSIAVLPFDNRSGDPEQEYFSDGITEDLITALSRLRWLFVIARNSTFSFKGRPIDIKQVGRQLGVRYILEGSVRKASQRVRVTAQLIEAGTGNAIWAERYDRELADFFDLQDELTETISAAVDAELAGSERNLARRKAGSTLDAWDFYQRGMWHLYKMSKANVAEARRLFESAVERAVDFASPHAALGYVAAIEALSGYTLDRQATLDAGLHAAERAVALDDRDAFNQFALGRVCVVRGERNRAILALEKSIALSPNSAPAHYGLGLAYFWVGQASRAVPLLDRAIRLSPADPQLWSFHYIRGNAHYFSGDVDAAIADQQAAVQNKGDEYLPHLSLAFVYARQAGLGNEARAAYADAARLKSGLSASFLRATIANLYPPYLEDFVDGLKTLGLPEN